MGGSMHDEEQFLSDLFDDLSEERSLQKYAFEMPTQLFFDMQEAGRSFELMMQVSEKLSFAYYDMIRKIEII